MEALSCPFHIECPFHNSTMKTPSDAVLLQLFCQSKYEDCEIAQRILANMPIPEGACPEGDVGG